MRKAEAEVMREHEMEVSLLVKSFFEAPVEEVLQRMAGAGGRRPSVAEAREVARRARAAGERPTPPPRTASSRMEAARAEAAAAAAERRSQALDAELREVTRARRDVMERRRARLENVREDGGDNGGGDDDGQSEARMGCAAQSRQGVVGRVNEQRAHSIGSAAAVALVAPLRVLSSAISSTDVRRVREHSRGHDAGEVVGEVVRRMEAAVGGAVVPALPACPERHGG